MRGKHREAGLNDLDLGPFFTLRSPEQMVREIQRMTGSCGCFTPSDGRHLAAAVRYHGNTCLQCGAGEECQARRTVLEEALEKAVGRVPCEPYQDQRRT
ncbi:uncharacterized protein V6R79_011731 [Siganus canaliculatus]